MSEALDKLIEAVEAGTMATDAPALTMEMSGVVYGALGDDLWATCVDAFDGSLDAALVMHEVLLGTEIYGWGAGPWGARVWLFSDHPQWDGSVRQDVELVNHPARAWLLAILRAYRTAQREA